MNCQQEQNRSDVRSFVQIFTQIYLHLYVYTFLFASLICKVVLMSACTRVCGNMSLCTLRIHKTVSDLLELEYGHLQGAWLPTRWWDLNSYFSKLLEQVLLTTEVSLMHLVICLGLIKDTGKVMKNQFNSEKMSGNCHSKLLYSPFLSLFLPTLLPFPLFFSFLFFINSPSLLTPFPNVKWHFIIWTTLCY